MSLPEKKIEEAIFQLTDKAESATGCQTIQLKGMSMHPFIEDSDLLQMEPISSQQLKFGDLCVYKSQGKMIIHRFIRRQRAASGATFLITKADNSPFFDPPFVETALVGKVVQVSRLKEKIILSRRFWQYGARWIAGLSYLEGNFSQFLWEMIKKIRPGASYSRICRFFVFRWNLAVKRAFIRLCLYLGSSKIL